MPRGVEVNGKRLRIYFMFDGERVKEPLGLEATQDNIDYAQRLVEQIEHEIRLGRFDYARFFPNSKRVNNKTVGHWLDLWLDIKRKRTADSTFRSYESKSNSHIRPSLGDVLVESLDQVDIETWISNDLASLSSRSIKHTLAILRSVIAMYRTRYPGAIDPTAAVRIVLPDDSDPDPFTRDEIDRILTTPPRSNRWPELNMVKFMIWSGPRVSEVLPLAWEDVDLDAGVVRFRRAKVRRSLKSTKTRRSERRHELIRPAREALEAQFDLTAHLPPVSVEVMGRDNRTVKTERLRFVFLNSNTGRPHPNDFQLRERFFKHHLERAGVRYRGPGQCRHTYISQMLTNNMPVEWISSQTGTSVEMIRRRYGMWINDDARGIVRLAEERLGF